MSPSYVCPCCFLNRISSLRNTPEVSRELMGDCQPGRNNDLHTKPLSQNKQHVTFRCNNNCSNTSLLIDSSGSTVQVDSTLKGQKLLQAGEFVRNLECLQSSDTFTVGDSDHSGISCDSKQCRSEDTFQSSHKTDILAEQIHFMLEEQKEFLKELDLPLWDPPSRRFIMEEKTIFQKISNSNTNDYTLIETVSKNKINIKKPTKKHMIDKSFKNKMVFLASGDKTANFEMEKGSSDALIVKSILMGKSNKNRKKCKKNKVSFNDEPEKLSEDFDLILQNQSETNLVKNYNTNKHGSVKMLFFPHGELKCSNSTMNFPDDANSIATSSSAYVTAADSTDDGFKQFHANQTIYTTASSASSIRLNVSSSDSRVLLEKE